MQAAAPKGLPLQASLFKRQALYKASPARGCGVERRLRRRKRDGAGLTVAEHKRASARAVRCGHRKPDGGCAARRRRRGALPVCDGNILQSPAGPCPRIRRGRCLHRPGSPAAAQAPMRRARSPALHCGRERAATDTRPLSARPAGEPMQASAPTQRGNTPQPSSTCHSCRPWFRRPFALHCRAGVHARRGGARRGHGRLMQTPSRKACNATKPD